MPCTNISLPSFNLLERIRRLSVVSSFSSGGQVAQNRGRRTAFVAVHFTKEKILKEIDTAINNGDATLLENVVMSVDIGDLEEDSLSYVHSVCSKRHVNLDILSALLCHGAKVDSYGKNDRFTALHLAVKHRNKELAVILIRHGALVDCPTRYEQKTALHMAACDNNEEMADILLNNRADTQCPDIYGAHALHMACQRGHNALVLLLLKRGADIHSYDNEGWTGLHQAAVAGHRDTVKLLVSKHANVDAQTRYGRTALHLATAADHIGVVNELLQADANPNIRDLHDKLAIAYARSEPVKAIVKVYTKKPEPQSDSDQISSIGSQIVIDPRLQSANNEFRDSRSSRHKAWSSTSQLSDNRKSSKLSAADLEIIERRHRRRIPKISMPSGLFMDSSTSINRCSSLYGEKGGRVEQSYEKLQVKTQEHIEDVMGSLRHFCSMVALTLPDSTGGHNKASLETALVQLTEVQDRLNDFNDDFRRQSDEFLSNWDEERSKNVSTVSPPYIALVSVFTEALLSILSQHPDADIWIPFLDKLQFVEEEVKDLLKFRLKLDPTLRLEQKLQQCIRFWARSCDVANAAQSGDQIMKVLLNCVETIETTAVESIGNEENEGGSGDLVDNILHKMIQLDMRCKTATHSDRTSGISQLLRRLRSSELLELTASLSPSSGDTTLFPVLETLTQSDESLSMRMANFREGDRLFQLMRGKLSDDENEQLVTVIRAWIKCGREDLLPLLL